MIVQMKKMWKKPIKFNDVYINNLSDLLEFAGKIACIMNNFFFALFNEYCKQAAFGDLNVSVFHEF